MIDYLKEPHTAVFSGPTGYGKTKLILDLIEDEYRYHFENIVILCSTLQYNKTYLERSWVWKNRYVFCIDPKDQFIKWIDGLSEILANEEILFILDDVITCNDLDKTRGALLNLSISGRHKKHSLWMLTQRYNKIPTLVRDQLKQLYGIQKIKTNLS